MKRNISERNERKSIVCWTGMILITAGAGGIQYTIAHITTPTLVQCGLLASGALLVAGIGLVALDLFTVRNE